MDGYVEPELGQRIAKRRMLSGLTQEELALRAGVASDTIAKIEQGKRQPSIPCLHRVANALDITTSALLGQPETLQPARDDARVAALRAAISPLEDWLGETDETDVPAVADLEKALGRMWRYLYAGKLGEVVATVPTLVADARSLARSQASPQAREVLASTYNLAGCVLVQLGHEDLALAALDRGRAVAAATNDALFEPFNVSSAAWAMLRQGRTRDAQELAVRTAERIEPRWSTTADDEVAMWGGLLLTGMAAANRSKRPDVARDLLRLARSAGDQMGADYQGMRGRRWSSFGPTVVRMHEVQFAVEQDEPQQALRLVPQIPTTLAPLSWSRHLLDVAHAQALTRQYREAGQTLFNVRERVPEWIRYQVLAREITRSLLAKPGGTRSERLRDLGRYLRVEA